MNRDYQESPYHLLSVEQAREHILSGLAPLESELVPLEQALGRVLAQDIIAAEDIPPLANSAMDGYAVRAADTAFASREHPVMLRLVGNLAAGQVARRALLPGEALRIMTGAPLPEGADSVVRFEDVLLQNDLLCITKPVRVAQDVREAGEDVRRGQHVLNQGVPLCPQEIGLLASLGYSQVQVGRRPLVAILSTGDELAEQDQAPAAGQIRDINGPTNAAQVRAAGGIPLELGIARDSEHDISQKIKQGIAQGAHLFITSGGVSAGDFDLVKRVLMNNGHLDFWWVNMKPGRPLAFGHLGGVPLIALPGNPVAAFISFALFAHPAILRLQGALRYELPSVYASLAEPIIRKDGRRHYLRVYLEHTSRGSTAHLTGDQGSGIVTSLVKADGLAVIPETCDHLERGSLVEVLLLR